MSKLHVCIDETWLFKVVEGNVFDRFYQIHTTFAYCTLIVPSKQDAKIQPAHR